MSRNQWRSFSELEKMQNFKLQKLVHHAYNNVDYYRSLFDSCGIRPLDVRSIKDLKGPPTTSREQLQNASLDEIVSKNFNLHECIRITGSGSTGQPLQLFYSRKDFSIYIMNWIRPLLTNGAKLWHRRLKITRPHNISDRKRWYNYLGLWNKKGISVFKNPQEWINMLRYYKPDILYGYSGSLKLLARYVVDNCVTDINPKFIFGVSDLVDYECRELIYTAFKRRLIDLHGSVEGGS